MRYLLISLLCVLTLSLTAQEAGCTYQQAGNYNPAAAVDDGTCFFGSASVFDYDGDGNIAINDFIIMLSYFGDTDSDSDGVFDSEDDCIDETACNYQSNPTYLCYYIDVVGVCGGLCNEDADGDGICDFNCGEQTGHEGYDYSTVQINDQCWFSENCRYLPEVSPHTDWSNPYQWDDTVPYFYVFGYEGEDVAAAQSTSNYETYGVLYNWDAVMTEGICPSGWHIPSDGEFTQLTNFLGGEGVAGGKMKEAGYDHWNFPNAGATNSSGFSGLGGGSSHYLGFWNIRLLGLFWTSSATNPSDEWNNESWSRELIYTNDNLKRSASQRQQGFSARCLQD